LLFFSLSGNTKADTIQGSYTSTAAGISFDDFDCSSLTYAVGDSDIAYYPTAHGNFGAFGITPPAPKSTLFGFSCVNGHPFISAENILADYVGGGTGSTFTLFWYFDDTNAGNQFPNVTYFPTVFVSNTLQSGSHIKTAQANYWIEPYSPQNGSYASSSPTSFSASLYNADSQYDTLTFDIIDLSNASSTPIFLSTPITSSGINTETRNIALQNGDSYLWRPKA